MQFLYIGHGFIKLPLVGAAAANLKDLVSCRMHDFCCHFKQLQTDGVNPLLSPAAPAIILNDLTGLHFHGRYQEGEHVNHLVGRLFHLENHPSGMSPAGGPIQELAIFHGVIDLIVQGCPVKTLIRVSRIVLEDGVMLDANRILAVVFLAGLIKSR